MLDRYQFFVTCPKHLEGTLEAELSELLSDNPPVLKTHQQGIAFEGMLEMAYQIMIWSRIANRVLLKLSEGEVATADQLYQWVQRTEWLDHLKPSQGLYIHFMGSNADIRHSQFGAQKVKDAIVDQIRGKTGFRPEIRSTDSFHLSVRLRKNQAELFIDLVGGSLHQRGYRQEQGQAPLKENLAAAMLHKSEWPEIAASGGSLVDPMCGSGTLLIEGALMAANIAPGLFRQDWSCKHWQQHDHKLWLKLVESARVERTKGLERLPNLQGWDINPKVIAKAKQNAQRAGLSGCIQWQVGSFENSQASTSTGLIAVNPPYGERMENPIALRALYRDLGQHVRVQFPNWSLVLITSDVELGFQTGLKAKLRQKVKNGALDAVLLGFALDEQPEKTAKKLSQGADMLANRLRKNQKKLSKWLKQSETNAYRLYDSDMPEYAVAIDCYADHVHIQEYAPPKSIDPKQAQKRLGEVFDAVIEVMQIPADHIAVKQRKRQKGTQQYEKQDQRNEWLEVQEGAARYRVNLFDYLDTGLFLDHRPLRQEVFNRSKDKRVLNLFAYTGAITVQAALGGSKHLTQVDLSKTYTQWAKENLNLNHIAADRYRLITADCTEWLKKCEKTYDLIVMDPPSFSNSKKMESTLDIQRDHVVLIQEAMRCLASEGLLMFSNNLRSFQLATEIIEHYRVENKTQSSIPKDFERNQKIHQCWYIQHK